MLHSALLHTVSTLLTDFLLAAPLGKYWEILPFESQLTMILSNYVLVFSIVLRLDFRSGQYLVAM